MSGGPQVGDDASAAAWVAWRDLGNLPLNDSSRIALRTLFPAETEGHLHA